MRAHVWDCAFVHTVNPNKSCIVCDEEVSMMIRVY